MRNFIPTKNLLFGVILPLALTACTAGEDEPKEENTTTETTETTSETTETTTETETETEVNPPDEITPADGSLVLNFSGDGSGEGQTSVLGMFTEVDNPHNNATLCVFFSMCGTDMPELDSITELTDAEGYDFAAYPPKNVGEISFGGSTLSTDLYEYYYELSIYLSDDEYMSYTDSGSYGLSVAATEDSDTTSWNEQDYAYFPSGYSSESDITGPDSIEVLTPDPTQMLQGSSFGNNLLADERVIDLTWTAASAEHFFIYVTIGEQYWVIRTTDDGEYQLDLNTLSTEDDVEVNITLSRITTSEITVDEQRIALAAVTTQSLSGMTSSVSKLDNPAEGGNTCADAEAVPNPISTGTHALGGALGSDLTDTLSTTCTDYGSLGPDMFTAVQLAVGETIEAAIRYGSNDPVIYLLDACGSDTCLAVADDGGSTTESISYTNNTGAEQTLYLGLDMWLAEDAEATLPDDYLLDIWIGSYEAVDISDTCAEALQSTAITTGTYRYKADFTSDLTDDVNTTCTDYGSFGQDAWLTAELAAGESLEISYLFEASDAVLYLQDECGAETCLAAADATLNGEAEELSYTNDSAATQTIYIGLDTWMGSADDPQDTLPDTAFMNITIE